MRRSGPTRTGRHGQAVVPGRQRPSLPAPNRHRPLQAGASEALQPAPVPGPRELGGRCPPRHRSCAQHRSRPAVCGQPAPRKRQARRQRCPPSPTRGSPLRRAQAHQIRAAGRGGGPVPAVPQPGSGTARAAAGHGLTPPPGAAPAAAGGSGGWGGERRSLGHGRQAPRF